MKENSFILVKEMKQKISRTDYADDLALLANTPTQAESLEQVVGGIDLHVNTDKKRVYVL